MPTAKKTSKPSSKAPVKKTTKTEKPKPEPKAKSIKVIGADLDKVFSGLSGAVTISDDLFAPELRHSKIRAIMSKIETAKKVKFTTATENPVKLKSYARVFGLPSNIDVTS